MSRKVSMQFGKPGAIANNAARNGKSVQFYDLEFTFANRSAQSGAVERKEHGLGFMPDYVWIYRSGGTSAAGSVILQIQSFDDTEIVFTVYNARTSGTSSGLYCRVIAAKVTE